MTEQEDGQDGLEEYQETIAEYADEYDTLLTIGVQDDVEGGHGTVMLVQEDTQTELVVASLAHAAQELTPEDDPLWELFATAFVALVEKVKHHDQEGEE